MKPVNVAVVGVGHLGRIHARILSGLPQFSLVALVDPVAENLEGAVRDYGAPGYRDPRELRGPLDAAVIATPTRFHHQVATELLGRGVHLLVEKPLASTYEQSCQLVDLARRCGAVLQVGHVERFNPAFAAALPHVGMPKYISAVRRSGFSFRSIDVGVVLDLMIHDIDLVLSLVRSPLRQVEALGLALFGRHEDVANARLSFENGCVAELSALCASRMPARSLEIWSQRGMASLDFTARTAAVVRPSQTIVRRELDVERLSAPEREVLKDKLLTEHLPVEQLPVEPATRSRPNWRILPAQFAKGAAPQVTGEAARRGRRGRTRAGQDRPPCVGRHARRAGGSARRLPTRQIIPGPHWGRKPAAAPVERREAG